MNEKLHYWLWSLDLIMKVNEWMINKYCTISCINSSSELQHTVLVSSWSTRLSPLTSSSLLRPAGKSERSSYSYGRESNPHCHQVSPSQAGCVYTVWSVENLWMRRRRAKCLGWRMFSPRLERLQHLWQLCLREFTVYVTFIWWILTVWAAQIWFIPVREARPLMFP